MYLVSTCMSAESYRRWLRSLLLCLHGVFRALINTLVCWFCLLNTDVWKSGKHTSKSSHSAPSSLRQRHHGQSPLARQKYQTPHQPTFFYSLLVNSKPTCFICCWEFCHYVCPQEKKKKYLWGSLCTLYLHTYQVRATVGDSGLCCCTPVMSYER